MKITFSGSGGVGKSTILNELFKDEEIRTGFVRVNSPTREIRNDVNINEDGDDTTQRLITANHITNSLIQGSAIYDRCSLDGLAYTMWLKNRGNVSIQTLRLAEAAFENIKYNMMFYIPPEFDVEDDGIRSTCNSFRDEVANIFEEIIFMYKAPVFVLRGTVEERVAAVKESIQKYDELIAEQREIENAVTELYKDAHTITQGE